MSVISEAMLKAALATSRRQEAERALVRAMGMESDAKAELAAAKEHPTNKLKVYGWTHYRVECRAAANGSRQTREVMAAKSVAEVMRATGLSRKYLTTYGGETGNQTELATALAAPGVVFWRPLNDYNAEYIAAN